MSACYSIKEVFYHLWHTVQWSGSRCLSGWMKQQRGVLRHRMTLEKPSQSWSSFRYVASMLMISFDLLVKRCCVTLSPSISTLESLLPRSICTTHAPLHSRNYWLLNTYKAHITRCLSRVWSITLRRTSVQLPNSSSATCRPRPMGQPGCSC